MSFVEGLLIIISCVGLPSFLTTRDSSNAKSCMCGGGAQNFEPRCENMEWNSMQDSGVSFNCEVIDALDDNGKNNICRDYADESFTADGLTLANACCKNQLRVLSIHI